MKLIKQSLVISASIIFVLAINQTPLYLYDAPILGLIIAFSVIYLILKQRRNRGEDLFVGSSFEVFAIITTMLLGIILTGGLNSNLFFLLYFLVFGIVFLFEPLTVFVLLLGVFVIFSFSLSEGDLFSNLVKLGSLGFLSPLSFFFGREFQRRERLEHELKDKTGQILEDAEVLKKDKNLPLVDIDEVDDIIQKSSELNKGE